MFPYFPLVDRFLQEASWIRISLCDDDIRYAQLLGPCIMTADPSIRAAAATAPYVAQEFNLVPSVNGGLSYVSHPLQQESPSILPLLGLTGLPAARSDI